MTTKISKRDIGILLVLLGALALFLSYQFIYKPNVAERNEVIEKTTQLNNEYNSLKDILDNQQKYDTEILQNAEKIEKIVARFPAMYLYEDGIMWLRALELNENFKVFFSSYTVGETVYSDSFQGRVNNVEKSFAYGASTINASYQIDSYDSMKKLVSTIYADKNPKNIESMAISFDNTTGVISGNININLFALTDGSKQYKAPEIPDMPIGLDCIFGEIIPPEEVEEE